MKKRNRNIIRISKRERFTVIDRYLLEDKRLSWSLRGILVYLLSQRDDWVLQVTDLIKQGDLKRDAIYKRIREAIEFGYITRIDHKNEKGRMIGVEYIVYEESTKPLTENPYTDFPNREKQHINEYCSLTKKENPTTTTTKTDFVFHKDISEMQKVSLIKVFISIDKNTAQEILFEIAANIDKKLIKTDEVSFAKFLVKSALNGSFELRAGIRYKEEFEKKLLNSNRVRKTNNQLPDLPEVDPNDPIAQYIESIKNSRNPK